MKKHFLFLLILSIFFASFTANVSAADTKYCELVSGEGIKFGSEVACGNEHFYVFDSTNEGIRLLAKYNLNAGETTYRVKIDDSIDYVNDWPAKNAFCSNIMQENGGYIGDTLTEASAFYNNEENNPYCFYSKDTREGELRQLEEARSAHWDENGDYLYPQVGDTYIVNGWGWYDNRFETKEFDFGHFVDTPSVGVPTFEYYPYDTNSSEKYPKLGAHFDNELLDFTVGLHDGTRGIAPILYEYDMKLKNEGYNILSTTIPTLDDLNNAAKTVLGKPFDYENDWSATGEAPEYDVPYSGWRGNLTVRNMTIKEYFGDDYSWLWDRSYWLRTATRYLYRSNDNDPSGLFVNQLGDVCSTSIHQPVGSGGCGMLLGSKLGLGLRPLITVDAVQFRIRTESTDGGEVEAPSVAFGNDNIALRAIAKAGYRLAGLTVQTEAGSTIVLSEEELERDNDGNIVLRADRFTMPFRNVVIKTNWESSIPESDAKNDTPEEPGADTSDAAEDEKFNPTADNNIPNAPNTYDSGVVQYYIVIACAAVAIIAATISARDKRS